MPVGCTVHCTDHVKCHPADSALTAMWKLQNY